MRLIVQITRLIDSCGLCPNIQIYFKYIIQIYYIKLICTIITLRLLDLIYLMRLNNDEKFVKKAQLEK